MEKDVFRPQDDRAAYIYDRFNGEAKKRADKPLAEWQLNERMAVYNAACIIAKAHNLPAPSLEDVEACEQSAMGHVDYGMKWAYGVLHTMMDKATA